MISGTFNFMIVFQAEHNILMHPFHMLGKENASPLVRSFCLSTIIGFFASRSAPLLKWEGTDGRRAAFAENLLPEKGGFETCLNGGSSSVGFLFLDNVQLYSCDKFFCNNSNAENYNASTNNPVPDRIAPRQLPGIYMILCLKNNKRYYGETTNVSARLSQHKSRLRRNIHEVPELQRDWNLYGEDFFEFSVLFISRDCEKTQREALELEYIARHYDLCYNKIINSSRKKENNPFWGHKHSEETKQQISKSRIENSKGSLPEGLAIMLKGEKYPSVSEAARKTNHSRDTIRRWLKDPNNTSCELIDISQPRQSPQTEPLNTIKT